MTEAEWLASGDPEPMLRFIQFGAAGRFGARLARLVGRKGAVETRKLRLFVLGCLRRVGPVTEMEYREDGGAPGGLLDPILVSQRCCREVRSRAAGECVTLPEFRGLGYSLPDSRDPINTPIPTGFVAAVRAAAAARAEQVAQCALLRDIFGNPFCPASFSPDWRTDTALALARQMYESREFSAMPILADALQDAGCADDDILGHCRGSGPHVRGCWVVDLVLGKE